MSAAAIADAAFAAAAPALRWHTPLLQMFSWQSAADAMRSPLLTVLAATFSRLFAIAAATPFLIYAAYAFFAIASRYCTADIYAATPLLHFHIITPLIRFSFADYAFITFHCH